MSVDIQEKAEEILIEGFCVLHDQFPKSAVEACNAAFAPILRDYIAENAENPNRGPCRHYITLPFEPPLYDPCFFDDDTVVAIASQVLGEDFAIDQYASDTPAQGFGLSGDSWRCRSAFPGKPRFPTSPCDPCRELSIHRCDAGARSV